MMGEQRRVSSILLILCGFTVVGGVRITGAGVAGEKAFLTSGRKGEIQCNFTLDHDEDVTKVTWRKNNQIIYVWVPGQLPMVDSRLEPLLEPNNDDCNLRIREANLTMRGNYSCFVESTLGQDEKKFQLAVFYSNGSSLSVSLPYWPDCLVQWKVSVPEISPRPDVWCGFHLQAGNEWFNIPSTQNVQEIGPDMYSFNLSATTPLGEIPLDTFFVCRNTLNNHRFSFMAGYGSSSFNEQSCAEPQVGEEFELYFSFALRSCSGGYKQGSIAELRCGPGYLDKRIRCDKNGAWEPMDSGTWPQCDVKVVQPGLSGNVGSRTILFHDLWLLIVIIVTVIYSKT